MEETKEQAAVSKLIRTNKENEKLIDDLKGKIVNFEKEILRYLDDRSKLARLYDMGIIDSAGNPIMPNPDDDQNEMKYEGQ